ncbi:DNA-binding MarR family transcriptional regulator [Anaerotaenia torta]|uniref:MarR family winged helix-turn-helix transcriptional regulator n=1 Tax=Anaerotaenia torta TaxID=433293 RepID=UPI003D220D9B
MNEISKLLSNYNGIIKENEQLYRNVTKALGLSDSAFWILYALRETEGGITQKDIINANYLPPQTINSALKKLEAEGFVELCTVSDKRKKQVRLTEKGEQLAAQTADRVLTIEMETMGSLTPQEQEEFLGLFRKYTDLLKKNLSILDKENIKIEQL